MTMHRTRFGDMDCSIARTFDVMGEPWSSLIVRNVWVGIRRFDDLQRDLGISSKVLAERLKWLTAQGVLSQRPYGERPVRNEYVLTEKGAELCAVLMAVVAWGDRWAVTEDGPPTLLLHEGCGHHTHAEVRCSVCGDHLRAGEVTIERGPGARPRAATGPA